MMVKVHNNEDDFISGIAPAASLNHFVPVKREFKPWHKPRKHWLRINQWAVETGKLIQEINSRHAEKVLTYLTLPGTDMLDVRIMCDKCAEYGYKVKYLGFNDPEETENNHQSELSISQSELAKSGIAHHDSFVVPDKFEALANPDKVAYQKMVDFGSFDIVNLDLCKSMAGYIPLQNQETYFDALASLIQYQSENRLKPWLLFITTRVDRNSIKKEALKALLGCVANNMSSHQSFHSQAEKAFGLNKTLVSNAIGGKALKPKELFDGFRVGLGKWLLHYLSSGQPKWTLEMLPSWSYQINPGNESPDMVSFAFKCTLIRERKFDKSKLSAQQTAAYQKDSVSELEAALALLKVIQGMENLDSQLDADEMGFAKLVRDAAKLMATARYDEEAYIHEFEAGATVKPKRRTSRQ